jgi:CHAT domain-containing protein
VHILSVGNPAFDRKAFPTLDVLRSARSEAEKIAELYDTKVLLVEDGAKEQRVKSEIDKADVVHIAAHAILDEYSPLQSKLILAKGIGHPGSEASEDGVLEAEELYRLKLPRTQLAVLSSCHSGVDHYYDGEGMLSLARPFTASRVPLVVASLWAVDSESTADLMIDFHGNRRCKRKPPSIAALREAKLKMLEQGSGRYRHPYFWAPFVAIGGYTKY